MTTLEFVKMILSKVSFDKKLFEKELKKGIKRLVAHEIKELRRWCYTQFGALYRGILNKVFHRTAIAVA
jgi:hypothetical protein